MNNVRYFLLTIFLTLYINADNKVLVLTCAFNRPDFVELQYKTFKAFLKDDYEFVVFNDANNRTTYLKIHEVCKKFNLRCIDIPQDFKRKRNDRPTGHMIRNGIKIYIDENRTSPSCFAADGLQYTLDTLGFNHDGIVLYVDADVFLIKEFNVTEYLKGHDLAGHPQSRGHVEYLWNGIIFMDMRTLPNKHTMNFDCGRIDDLALDTGGQIYCYLKENSSLRLLYYPSTLIQYLPRDSAQLHNLGFDNVTCDFILANPVNADMPMEFYVDNHFLHYRAASNWNHSSQDFHRKKTAVLITFINALLAQRS